MNSNYEVAQPTPEAAILDGMYCRGGGCQYRTGAPPPLVSPTPPVPIITFRGLSGVSAVIGMPFRS